jgi:hypothetical protein
VLTSLQSKFLTAALSTNPHAASFKEEMYILPYEICTDDDSQSHVPICSAFNVNKRGKLDQIQCKDKFAKYPAIGGVIKMCKFFGLADLAKEFSQHPNVQEFMNLYNENTQDPVPNPGWFARILECNLFQGLVYPKSNAFPTVSELRLSDRMETKTDSVENSMLLYRKNRKTIQDNVNIRFAFLDGQHRVAIAIHVLGGYQVSPKQNLRGTYEKYNLVQEMKLNGKPTLRFAVPKTHTLDEDFMLQCVKQSNEIINRKVVAEKDTWRK